MYKILKNVCLTANIYLLEIEHELISNHAHPGQFVIVMAHANSEKIPLTIYKYESGIVSLIYQVVGASTLELSLANDSIYSITGPLGKSSILVDNTALEGESVLFVAGGIGIAPIMPQLKYLSEKGINCDLIYGAKSQNYIILESEIKKYAKNYIITTDDGSYGTKGNVLDAIDTVTKNYAYVVAIGPVKMMQSVSLKTKALNLKTIVSMNPLMVDGTGMCGACRVNVGGKIKFACIDGPEFDGHLIDFDSALKRLEIYKTFEGRKYLEAIEGESHSGKCGVCEHD